MTKTVQYRRGAHKVTVRIDDPRDTCVMCQRKFKGRSINTHHWKYVWNLQDVKKKPELALENTVKLCAKHHRIGNDLREIVDWYARGHYTKEGFKRLVESMPDDMQRVWRELIS
jgi:hypothetical protein